MGKLSAAELCFNEQLFKVHILYFSECFNNIYLKTYFFAILFTLFICASGQQTLLCKGPEMKYFRHFGLRDKIEILSR